MKTKPIEFSEWRGATRWRCPSCAFDAGDEATVAEHIQWRHRPPAPTTGAIIDDGVKPKPTKRAVDPIAIVEGGE